jgi:uncharacterized phage protein (predicted DNA packaging)
VTELILNLQEVKEFLRIEQEFIEEDSVINMLITAAESYLFNATGIQFDATSSLAKLFCLVLITDWYENRDMIGKASDTVRLTIDSILIQLQYCYSKDVNG